MNKLAMLALGRKVGGSGGSGGVSSWNDLTDKPFYEKRTVLFQCDFDTSGPDYLPVEGMGALYKVTDDVFTSDDLVGGTMIGKKGTTITVTSEMISEEDGILLLEAMNEELLCVFILLSTSTTDVSGVLGLNLPSTGTYVLEMSPEVNGVPPELELEPLASIEAVIIKKLDEKYLPDLNKYATKEELSSYATKSSLSSYATKSSLSSYATKQEVTTLINDALGVIENGTY